MKETVDLILFDAGQTLLQCRPSMADIVQRSLAETGLFLTPEQAAQSEALMWKHYQRVGQERGTRTSVQESWDFWHSVYEGITADLALPDPRRHGRTLAEAFKRPEAWQAFADVHPALEQLRARGIRLGVVSNWTDNLHRILNGLALSPFFEVVITSAEAGIEKPDPAIFTPALEQAGVDPARCLYVGDSLTQDLPSSTAAGLSFALIDRENRYPEVPCRRLSSLLELMDPLIKAG